MGETLLHAATEVASKKKLLSEQVKECVASGQANKGKEKASKSTEKTVKFNQEKAEKNTARKVKRAKVKAKEEAKPLSNEQLQKKMPQLNKALADNQARL